MKPYETDQLSFVWLKGSLSCILYSINITLQKSPRHGTQKAAKYFHNNEPSEMETSHETGFLQNYSLCKGSRKVSTDELHTQEIGVPKSFRLRKNHQGEYLPLRPSEQKGCGVILGVLRQTSETKIKDRLRGPLRSARLAEFTVIGVHELRKCDSKLLISLYQIKHYLSTQMTVIRQTVLFCLDNAKGS